MKNTAYAYACALALLALGAGQHEENWLAAFIAILAAALFLDLAEKAKP